MNKTLHFVWVGDESLRPDNCIDTWRKHNPEWNVRIWGNDDLHNRKWRLKKHMTDVMNAKMELAGVADLMRYEILFNEGGFALDADAVALRPLEDWLFDCGAFACWENETARPGLIANGYMYAKPAHPLLLQIINDLRAMQDITFARAWKVTGPLRITETLKTHHYRDVTIHPSHYFMPVHLSGVKYEGPGPVFGDQYWGSTRLNYDTLHTKQV